MEQNLLLQWLRLRRLRNSDNNNALILIPRDSRVLDFIHAKQVDNSGWKAGLSLGLAHRGDKTVLARSAHFGPLRIQRPFYPDGPVCHLYLLHPPGGMVAGDDLAIDLDLEDGARALVTTPAAGKFYRVERYAPAQYQGVRARLQAGAVLEWLPQETIAFNGARGELVNRFDLAADALLIGWDVVCLGRRASGESFDRGSIRQKIEIYREGRPLFIDRVAFEGGGSLMDAPWGMRQCSVSGTFFATLGGDSSTAETLRSALPVGPEWGLTRRGEVLLARYLGHSAETCRRGFEQLWYRLRPQLLQRPAVRPRIWNT